MSRPSRNTGGHKHLTPILAPRPRNGQKCVLEGAVKIHGRILEHADSLAASSEKEGSFVREKWRSEGFAFDALETESGGIQLVEVNPFGAMSGFGSCLFHWLRDARVIYDAEDLYSAQHRVELRIAL